MTHRDATPADFEGKKIILAEVDAINVWRLHFDDGTNVTVELNYFGPQAGYGMAICECETPVPELPR